MAINSLNTRVISFYRSRCWWISLLDSNCIIIANSHRNHIACSSYMTNDIETGLWIWGNRFSWQIKFYQFPRNEQSPIGPLWPHHVNGTGFAANTNVGKLSPSDKLLVPKQEDKWQAVSASSNTWSVKLKSWPLSMFVTEKWTVYLFQRECV